MEVDWPQIGGAREELARDLPALFVTRVHEDLHGLVLAPRLVGIAEPGERKLLDLTRSPLRRLGSACDPGERALDDVAASNCMNAYFVLDVIAEEDLTSVAERRAEQAECLAENGSVKVGIARIAMTDRARAITRSASLRLLDLRDDPDGPTYEALNDAGRERGSAEWRTLQTLRARHNLVGFLVCSRRQGITVLLNIHALELLLERGFIRENLEHDAIPIGWLQRLQRFVDIVEAGVDQIVRLMKAQERLANAAWRCLRAWLGRSSTPSSAIRRGHIAATAAAVALGLSAALLKGLGPL